MNTEITQERRIELSISKDYVCDWGIWEAIREIVQNAQDEQTKGNKLYIKSTNKDDRLIIGNKGSYLSIESLVLGNGTKRDDDMSIGKYGEGYKLALVVLLRNGLKVKIKTGDEIWTPEFSYSETFNTEVLTINIKLNLASMEDRVEFTIDGIKDYKPMLCTKSLTLNEFLHYHRIDKIVDSEYGKIILDPKYAGMFYVEGLYIQTDESFKYGYSFNNEVVELDRDRRAINYYDLLNLTTDSLLHQKENITIVEHAITNKYKDMKALDDFYKDVTKDFAVGYAEHFIEKHNIDEDTFVGTEKEVKLSGSSKVLVTDSVQAKIVNKGLGKEDEYNRVKDLARQKDNKDVAWTYYKESTMYKLHEWLKHNCKRLSNKQINEFIDITNNLSFSNHSCIEDDVYDSLIVDLSQINPNFKRVTKDEK